MVSKNTLSFIDNLKSHFFESRWAQKEGAIFVYSTQELKSNIQELRRFWPDRGDYRSSIYYSIKANPNPYIIKEIISNIDGLDASSLGELELLKKLKIDGKKITVSGPAKTDAMMLLAGQLGVQSIHLDSFKELERWNKLQLNKNTLDGRAIKKTLRIALGGSAKKLGIGEGELEEVLRLWSGAPLDGFHAYLGRESFSIEIFKSILDKALSLKKKYPKAFSKNFALYLGPGLPSSCQFQAEEMSSICKDKDLGIPVHIETGRFIVNTAGVYLAKVLAVKRRSSEQRLVIINGGLQHLATNMVSPVFDLKGIHCEVIRSSSHRENHCKFQVYGSLGTRNDLIHPAVDFPLDIDRGDWILFFPCGAYGYTAAANQFISPDHIREYLWDGSEWSDISPKSELHYIEAFSVGEQIEKR